MRLDTGRTFFYEMTPYDLDWWYEKAIEYHDGKMQKAIKEEYARKQKYEQ